MCVFLCADLVFTGMNCWENDIQSGLIWIELHLITCWENERYSELKKKKKYKQENLKN